MAATSFATATASSFSIDARGRIWFHDTGSDTRIYVSDTTGARHGFSEGEHCAIFAAP